MLRRLRGGDGRSAARTDGVVSPLILRRVAIRGGDQLIARMLLLLLRIRGRLSDGLRRRLLWPTSVGRLVSATYVAGMVASTNPPGATMVFLALPPSPASASFADALRF